jgi:CBS domain-containing protein
MASHHDRTWTWRLGRLFASLAKKLHYPALASVPVSAAMLSRVEAVGSGQTLADAATLVARGTGPLPVLDEDGRPVGVVTRNSLAHALNESGPRASIAFASCGNVIEVSPSASADEVLARLRAQPDSVAMVVDHGSPVGMLTVEQLDCYLASLNRA